MIKIIQLTIPINNYMSGRANPLSIPNVLRVGPVLGKKKTLVDLQSVSFFHNFIRFRILQDGIDAIEDVIYHIETYDVTTIRASTPMFLMSRKIKSLGVKMVISGEGSDEIFGGYLYFHKAPNKEEFHRETCRKVTSLFSTIKIALFSHLGIFVILIYINADKSTSPIRLLKSK